MPAAPACTASIAAATRSWSCSVFAGPSAEKLRPSSHPATTRPCSGAPGSSVSRRPRPMSAPVSSPTGQCDGQASTHESHTAVVERYTKGVALDHMYRRALAMARREQLDLGRQHRRLHAMRARGPKPHDASGAIGPVLDIGQARMHIPTKETRHNKNPAYAPPTGSLVGELSPGKRLLEDRLLMLQDARNMDEGVLLAEQLTRARLLSAAGGGPAARATPRTWAAFAIDPAATPATLAVRAGLDFEGGKSSSFTGEDTFYTSVPGIVIHAVPAPVSVDPAGSEGAEPEPGSPIAPYLAAARAAEAEARQLSRDIEEESAPQGWTPAVHVYNDSNAPAAWTSAREASASSPFPDSTSSRTPTWYASDPVPLPEEASPASETQSGGSAPGGLAGRPGSPPTLSGAVTARPGPAAVQPGSAASRSGPAAARPGLAASHRGSAASRQGSAMARLSEAARSPGKAAPQLQEFAEHEQELRIELPQVSINADASVCIEIPGQAEVPKRE